MASHRGAALVVSHEGPQWVRFRAPSLLVVPEVLSALHLGNSAEATFHFERAGKTFSAALHGTRRAVNVLSLGGSLPPGWRSMADGITGARPLWMQRPDTLMWFTVLPDRTLYIVSGHHPVRQRANERSVLSASLRCWRFRRCSACCTRHPGQRGRQQLPE